MQLGPDSEREVLMNVPWMNLESACKAKPSYRGICKTRKFWIYKLSKELEEPQHLLEKEFDKLEGNLKERSLEILARRGVVTAGSENYLDFQYCLLYAFRYGSIEEMLYFLELLQDLGEFTHIWRISPYDIHYILKRVKNETNLNKIIDLLYQYFIKRRVNKETSLTLTELVIRGYPQFVNVFTNGKKNEHYTRGDENLGGDYFSSRVMGRSRNVHGLALFMMIHSSPGVQSDPIGEKYIWNFYYWKKTGEKIYKDGLDQAPPIEVQLTKIIGSHERIIMLIELGITQLIFSNWEKLTLEQKVDLANTLNILDDYSYCDFIIECLKHEGSPDKNNRISVDISPNVYLEYQLRDIIEGEYLRFPDDESKRLALKTGWDLNAE